jgi:hypothetical protein
MKVCAQSSQNTAVTPVYPDSTAGLEHLVKDILKAQKAGDGARAQQLVDSLLLPDYKNWYSAEFDEEVARTAIASYQASAAGTHTRNDPTARHHRHRRDGSRSAGHVRRLFAF